MSVNQIYILLRACTTYLHGNHRYLAIWSPENSAVKIATLENNEGASVCGVRFPNDLIVTFLAAVRHGQRGGVISVGKFIVGANLVAACIDNAVGFLSLFVIDQASEI